MIASAIFFGIMVWLMQLDVQDDVAPIVFGFTAISAVLSILCGFGVLT